MSDYFKPGLGNAASYQVSGRPFVTSSLVVPAESGDPLVVSFPTVTRSITIRNDSSATIRVGFSSNGVSGSAATNYFTLTENNSYQEELKVIKLYMISDSAAAGSATVIAGLTNIETSSLQNNWSGSSGVG